MTDMRRAVQDVYSDDFAQCYGCGRLNDHGLHIRTMWEGEDAVAHFRPEPWHTAVPGFVYGGLIASLIDCHGIGTAAAAVERAAGREIGDARPPRFVTASLHVDFRKPTPLGPDLELRARARLVTERKVIVDITLAVEGDVTARGEVVAVRIPAAMT